MSQDSLSPHARYLYHAIENAEDSGYFGPGSAIWTIAREGVMGLGLGRALLMQIAHPWVAQSVIDHSDIEARPLDRLMATGSAAELLVFGSRSQADRTARRIRSIHRRVHGVLREDARRWRAGQPYRADDPEALLWVLITLADTALTLYDACFGLNEDLASAYLEDTALLGTFFGAPGERVPRTRATLREYVDHVIADGTVAVGGNALRLAETLRHMGEGREGRWRWYSHLNDLVAERTLHPELRRQYGRRSSRGMGALAFVGNRAVRRLVPRLPESVRVDPLTRKALRRGKILRELELST